MTRRDEGMRPMDEHDWLAERFEENRGGWLTTVVARVSLNMLRSRASRREEPLDSHVPDPVISREEAIDPEDQALLAEGVGLALLVVLETLAPAERLAFVLHDMFAVPFEEIAAILGRSPPAAGSRTPRPFPTTTWAASESWSTPSSPLPAAATSTRLSRCSTRTSCCAPTAVSDARPPRSWFTARRPSPARRSPSRSPPVSPGRPW